MLIYLTLIASFYTVTSCLHKDSNDQQAIEVIKSGIMTNLNLKEAPRIFRKPSLYAQIIASSQAEITEQQSRHKHSQSEEIDIQIPASYQAGNLLLDLSTSIDRNLRPVHSEFYFYIDAPTSLHCRSTNTNKKQAVTVELQHLLADGSYYKLKKMSIPTDRMVGWHNLIIPTKAMRRILRQSHNNRTLSALRARLQSPDCSETDFTHSLEFPFLSLHLKRADQPPAQPDCSSSKGCCARPLEIDFHAMGWDFVVHPRKFTSNYCAGDCRINRSSLSANQHVLTAYLKYSGIDDQTTCCAPDNVSSVQLVYIDLNGVIRTNGNTLQIVNSCKCY